MVVMHGRIDCGGDMTIFHFTLCVQPGALVHLFPIGLVAVLAAVAMYCDYTGESASTDTG